MAIKVVDNTQRVQEEAKNIVQQIEQNAQNGNPYTDIYVEKHLGIDVRREINKILDADGTQYTWCTVRRGSNQFTGRAEYFISETIGDEKHYKIKINS